MATGYEPYFDPDYESLIERIHAPRVCVDNETCTDCTLVKVDRANKHEILVEMVQVLTDLDLLISKSYISSDGGWCMDVFHVTDQLGHKLTDNTLIRYIEQSLCGGRRGDKTEVNEVTSNRTCIGSIMRSLHASTDYTAFELMAIDKPGLLSEISAVLAELRCNVAAAVVWTHKKRAASVLYIEDESKGGGPITSSERMLRVEEQLAIVVGSHHCKGERRIMRLVEDPPSERVHTGRRLHQLMQADMHHEISCSKDGNDSGKRRRSGSNNNIVTEVCIENCNEKGYTVVNVRCKDRPKLLFDTVCTLTDLGYVVFHAAISSRDSLAVQEYYIRRRDGCTLDSERERQRVMQSLVEAAERRVSHGVKLDVCTKNRVGLLSDITRVFREHGLSVSRAEISTLGEKAIGSFYVTDAYTGKNADPKTVELVRSEIGATVLEANKSISAEWSSNGSNSQNNRSSSTCSGDVEERPAKSSLGLGSLLWAPFVRLSSNSWGSA
ncbi:ACT domain-containing protein ACR1-like [Papaver somniferum]|uniref:ACT domain-containing protein ACR1-like n=1 Tax=Papaver somniferum TaxID=3469 RepID=UPI000E70256C|nr:ACT domain-containing protein ACR1-like [Papaver somniferum]